MNRLLIFLVVGLLFHVNNGFAQHFSTIWIGNPYQPMNIIIQEALDNNVTLEIGDEIAVFETGDNGLSICVGKAILTQAISPTSPLIIVASSDDPTTESIIDGFLVGNNIQFHIWDVSESMEVTTVMADYNTSFASTYQALETAICTLNTCARGDYDCDCDIDIVDVTMAAYRYGSAIGDDNYDPLFDQDGDGDIDIVDITMVAYTYGWTCED